MPLGADGPRDATACRETARAMPRGAEGPRDVTSYRRTARRYVVQRSRATLERAERPRDATWCRETARRHVVQRDRTTLRRAEEPRDATRYRETAQCHVVQRDRSTSRRAEGPRDATFCRGTADFMSRRGTARHYSMQRNHAMPRGAETARRYSVQRKVVQIEIVLRPRRRPIDHTAFWTGVGANRTRPAHPDNFVPTVVQQLARFRLHDKARRAVRLRLQSFVYLHTGTE